MPTSKWFADGRDCGAIASRPVYEFAAPFSQGVSINAGYLWVCPQALPIDVLLRPCWLLPKERDHDSAQSEGRSPVIQPFGVKW